MVYIQNVYLNTRTNFFNIS